MFAKILLWFGVVSNVATLIGLWIAYISAPATLKNHIAHVLIVCGGIASIALYLAFAAILAKRATFNQEKKLEREAADATAGKSPEPIDTTVKDSDPQMHVEFDDGRFHAVNRGTLRSATNVCMGRIRLRQHWVTFPKVGYSVAPSNSFSIVPEIRTLDDKGWDGGLMELLLQEYGSYKSPSLHELTLPLVTTYQDEGNNLFEARCELVFNPSEYSKTWHEQRGPITPVTIRKHVFRKIAVAVMALEAAAHSPGSASPSSSGF